MTMVFRYKKIDRPDPLPPLISPVIPVTLIGNNSQLDVLALLDSGADTTALPRGIGELLNLNLTSKREEVVGIGKAEAVTDKIRMLIRKGHERYIIPVEIKIILSEEFEIPILLGRKDFFDSFHITFEENDKRILLKKVNV